jgi:transcription initiation factor TFIID subunit 2
LKHGCLDYFDEIKHPMDLGTVMKKVEQKKYRSMGQLASDIELVFNK